MVHVHRGRWLIAGFMIAAIGAAEARSQVNPTAPAPVPLPPLPPAAIPGALAADDVGNAAAAVPTAGSCTCGDRRGLSRWRWHRTHCKRNLQEHLAGYAEEFNEWPLGESLYAHARTQTANGQGVRMCFYHCDFEADTAKLNSRGRDKLAAVSQSLATTFFPVVIERTATAAGQESARQSAAAAALDLARRRAVLDQLAQGPFPVPDERVVIGPRIANGMTGVESMLIYTRQLSNLNSGGSIGAGGSTGFVGGVQSFDAGGLSGSAVSGGGGTGR